MDQNSEKAKNVVSENGVIGSVEVKPAELEVDEATQERGGWGNQIEFILTCIGYAVGLGNVWRFPFLTYKNGGGAFLIPYAIMLLFIGMPVVYFELCFGQFAGQGPISIWNVSPIFRGVGIGMVAVAWMIGIYYNVIIAWSIYYFFASMGASLPWISCDNAWNTIACIVATELKQLSQNETLLNSTLADRNLTSRTEFKSPSEEFYYNKVLQLSEGIDRPDGIVWQLALTLMLAWVIIWLVLFKGISSLGKVVYFVTIFPYVMMTAMLIRGATLEGASKGLEFYMKPNLSKLLDAEVWSDAATQIFFSLSACIGGLIAMSSYNKFNNNVLRDSIIVPLVNAFTSVYAGLAIFSVLGFMANAKGVPVDQVVAQGPGLVFIVYPEGLSQMPASVVWAILFFFMMILLGFSTEFSMMETLFTAIMDAFPTVFRRDKTKPIILRTVCCVVFFLITLPMVTRGGLYLFHLTDTFISGFPLLIIGFFELIAVNWVYGYENFSEDVSMMLGKKPNVFFKICWVAISPCLLVVVIIFKSIQYKRTTLETYEYPLFAEVIGWLQVVFAIMFIPIIAIYALIDSGIMENIKRAAAPLAEWGPASPKDRTGRYAPKSNPGSSELKPIAQNVLLSNSLYADPKQFYDNLTFTDESDSLRF